MMKKTLLAILALIVIVALVWVAVGNKKKSKPAANPVQRTAVVTVSASGFTPAALTVKSGTKVTWTNLDTTKAGHRIKADPYPTGDSLPALDSKINLALGATYSYTFDAPGTYKYHDQVNPLLNGEVVVTQ